MMKMKREGFTLLELLVVIIIIGILSALAIPRYIDVTEKAKGGEAIANLGILRNAELRYFAEYDEYSADLSELDVEETGKFFTYAISAGAGSSDFTTLELTATRVGSGPHAAETLIIDEDGAWTGTWPWLPQ